MKIFWLVCIHVRTRAETAHPEIIKNAKCQIDNSVSSVPSVVNLKQLSQVEKQISNIETLHDIIRLLL